MFVNIGVGHNNHNRSFSLSSMFCERRTTILPQNMPKRCNPFGDNSSPQFKTHVREKEVNYGVCQQTRMQPVYERTHKLLCAGMKEMQGRSVPLDANDNFLSQMCETTKSDKSDWKQMHIDKNCQLVGHDDITLMDIETDSNSHSDSIADYSLVCNLAKVAEPGSLASSGSSVRGFSSFGLKCGRSTDECNLPLSVTSKTSSSAMPVCGDISATSVTGNAFSHMKQAKLKSSSSGEPFISVATCINCRQAAQPLALRRCQFCESCVCCSCVQQCHSCLLNFCHLCSVINYDLPAERSFCLNCAAR